MRGGLFGKSPHTPSKRFGHLQKKCERGALFRTVSALILYGAAMCALTVLMLQRVLKGGKGENF